MVVLVGEEVEECLELGDRARLVELGGQPVLHRLLEPHGLPAGGGVPGPGVLLDDVTPAQFGFEGVLAAVASVAGQPDRVDDAVVSERGRRNPVPGKGFAEGRDHDRGSHPGVRGHVCGW